MHRDTALQMFVFLDEVELVRFFKNKCTFLNKDELNCEDFLII